MIRQFGLWFNFRLTIVLLFLTLTCVTPLHMVGTANLCNKRICGWAVITRIPLALTAKRPQLRAICVNDIFADLKRLIVD